MELWGCMVFAHKIMFVQSYLFSLFIHWEMIARVYTISSCKSPRPLAVKFSMQIDRGR